MYTPFSELYVQAVMQDRMREAAGLRLGEQARALQGRGASSVNRPGPRNKVRAIVQLVASARLKPGRRRPSQRDGRAGPASRVPAQVAEEASRRLAAQLPAVDTSWRRR